MYPQNDPVADLLLEQLPHPAASHDVDAELDFDIELVQHVLDVIGDHSNPSPRVLEALASYLPSFDRSCFPGTARRVTMAPLSV